MRTIARKLRREAFNIAREADVSAWRSAAMRWIAKLRRDDGQELRYLSGSLAHTPDSASSYRRIQKALELAGKQSYRIAADQTVNLSYCLILKSYLSEREKGILLISFEDQLDRFLDAGLLPAIQAKYHIMFLPSYTGLYSPALFKLAALSGREPVFVLPVHAHERAQVKRLSGGFIPLPFNAASWVNKDFFEDRGVERDIDCLMVAIFSSVKRHWLLFKALKRLPASISAMCVGVPLGSRNANSIRREAEDYGVSDRVTIVEDPSQESLRLYFQRAKVFCAMSYREGSFIAVAEALMSGTPVVMFRNAHIGTKNLITSDVGALVDSVPELREQIMKYMDFEDHDRVREVARGTVSAQANCRKLNELLAEWSHANGRQWTENIEGFYSMRLSFYYFDDDAKERLNGDFQYLKDQGINVNLP